MNFTSEISKIFELKKDENEEISLIAKFLLN